MRSRAAFLIVVLLACAACRSSEDAARARLEPVSTGTSGTPAGAARVEAADPATRAFDELLASLGVRRLPAGDAVEVRGWVNMNSGAIEVLACAPEGKLHEALLVLDCVPSGLHAGLLAIGLEPGQPGRVVGGGEFQPPSGEPVEISVSWSDEHGAERTVPVEQWLVDTRTGAALAGQAWVYAGSFELPIEGKPGSVSLAADAVKTLVATYQDSSALLQIAGIDGYDDTLFEPRSAAMPAKGTAVTVTFRRMR